MHGMIKKMSDDTIKDMRSSGRKLAVSDPPIGIGIGLIQWMLGEGPGLRVQGNQLPIDKGHLHCP